VLLLGATSVFVQLQLSAESNLEGRRERIEEPRVELRQGTPAVARHGPGRRLSSPRFARRQRRTVGGRRIGAPGRGRCVVLHRTLYALVSLAVVTLFFRL